MSITPTAIIHSASPRPYSGVQATGMLRTASSGAKWVCGDHMSTGHNPTTVETFGHNPITVETFGSKRLGPGFFVGVLT